MYRDKNKPPLSPQDTKFWSYAAKLKKNGHKTIVHALAWESPKAYQYLLSLFRDKTPLERITILLWRDYQSVVRKLEMKGYGTLSPSSLRTFREKYFLTKDLPNPELDKNKTSVEATLAHQLGTQLTKMAESLDEIERRVYPTKIGHNLRKKAFDSLRKAVILQTRLS